jgi:cytochrome P450
MDAEKAYHMLPLQADPNDSTVAPLPFTPTAGVACGFSEEAREGTYGPVRRDRLPNGIAAWLVTRYEDVTAGLTDPRLVLDAASCEAALLSNGDLPSRYSRSLTRVSRNLLNTDPPDHTRLRRFVTRGFSARRLEAVRSRVHQIADQLVSAIAVHASRGRVVNLVETLAFPLPIIVICEMLGVPYSDRNQFRAWSDAIITLEPGTEATAASARAMSRMDRYFTELIGTKRARPGDDLVTTLLATTEDGDRLNNDELHAMLRLLLVAGHETTSALIGSSVLLLLRHPEQLAILRADPSLTVSAVEECLRFAPPVAFALPRFTTAGVQIGEVTVPPGEAVALGLWTADHDPERFASPNVFDIKRGDNPQIAFGHGAHFCLGAALARLEAEAALGALLRKFPEMSLAVPYEAVPWKHSAVRGPSHLPVRLVPGSLHG